MRVEKQGGTSNGSRPFKGVCEKKKDGGKRGVMESFLVGLKNEFRSEKQKVTGQNGQEHRPLCFYSTTPIDKSMTIVDVHYLHCNEKQYYYF